MFPNRISLFLLIVLCGALVFSIPARAVDADVKTVMVSSLYGAAIGTGLGLVSLPAHQSARGIFVGSSVGFFLGIAVGIYHINHRDDPQNPLRADLFENLREEEDRWRSVRWSPPVLFQWNATLANF